MRIALKHLLAVTISLAVMQCTFAITPNSKEDPVELQRLRKTYTQRKTAALKPLTQQYVRELERLKRKYRNRRDHEKAVQVENEIVRVSTRREEALREIILPAKEATLKGDGIVYQINENCLGYWGKVENKVSWEIEGVKPGYYEVSMVYSCGNDGGGDMLLTADTAKLKTRVKPTGSWTMFDKKIVGRIDIENSNLVLMVRSVRKPGKYFMNLRRIILRPVKK